MLWVLSSLRFKGPGGDLFWNEMNANAVRKALGETGAGCSHNKVVGFTF